MSGTKINNYSTSNVNLTNIMTCLDTLRIGQLYISLNEYNSTLIPTIYAGSVAEVAGTQYKFSTTESFSTSNVISTSACSYSMILIPSSSQCSAAFSTIIPAWRSDYQGYYNSTTSNYRSIGKLYFDGTNYLAKTLYYNQDLSRKLYYTGISTYTMPGAAQVSTYIVPMTGSITDVISISLLGQYPCRYGQTYVSSFTILSTSVSVKITTENAGSEIGSIFVSGVSQ